MPLSSFWLWRSSTGKKHTDDGSGHRTRSATKLFVSASGKTERKTEGKAEGEAKGRADSVLTIFAARGLDVPEHVRARILGCQDMALLDQWIAVAVTAKNAADVVAGSKS